MALADPPCVADHVTMRQALLNLLICIHVYHHLERAFDQLTVDLDRAGELADGLFVRGHGAALVFAFVSHGSTFRTYHLAPFFGFQGTRHSYSLPLVSPNSLPSRSTSISGG